jgi:casein kinase 1
MIADKIISSIEFMHYKNYLHRDIKPENFVMGLGKKLHQIYIIDLAFATSYFNPLEKCHRSDKIN